jgi:hypothetical protein
VDSALPQSPWLSQRHRRRRPAAAASRASSPICYKARKNAPANPHGGRLRRSITLPTTRGRGPTPCELGMRFRFSSFSGADDRSGPARTGRNPSVELKHLSAIVVFKGRREEQVRCRKVCGSCLDRRLFTQKISTGAKRRVRSFRSAQPRGHGVVLLQVGQRLRGERRKIRIAPCLRIGGEKADGFLVRCDLH